VNPPEFDVFKKTERTDIENVVALHSDLDPRKGEELASERERLSKIIDTAKPIPSCTIDSGRGFWIHYLLSEPLPVNRSLERAERAKAYNAEIANKLNADTVANIDRIARLPGTINHKTGALAKVKWNLDDNGQPLTYKASDVADPPKKPVTTDTPQSVSIDAANIKRLATLDDLPVPERVKVIINHGRNPLEPPKEPDDSRSAWLFDAVCNLVRAGVDDATIYSVITDSRFKISESVLELGSKAHGYAERQIANARADVGKDAPAKSPYFTDKVGKGDDKPGPRDLARTLLANRAEPLIHLNDEYHTWRGGAYCTREEKTIRKEGYDFLERIGWKPTPKAVSATLDALVSLVLLDKGDVKPPCWINGKNGPDPREVLVCRNGLLHLPTGELRPHSADYLTFNMLDYDYAPDAPTPDAWLSFLSSLWPGAEVEIEVHQDGKLVPKIVTDDDCIAELQKWFGYLLTLDTSQQKILCILGPKRSGKGTIMRVLRALVGEHNTCSPGLTQFGTPHGKQVLIGKQLATINDLRIGHKADKAAIAETLLQVSGEDYVTVQRKYLDDWGGQLRTRFAIISNETPKLPDASGALASRFIVLQMRQSFYGREDRTLTDKLLSELPGILNWAIDGWRKLQSDGRFIQPASSREAADQLDRLNSDVRSFVQDACELQADFVESTDTLYRCFVGWARRQGMKYWQDGPQFGKDLSAAYGHEIHKARPRMEGERKQVYVGLRVKESARVELMNAATTADAKPDTQGDLPF
jgi:P4 family phage/plasmid primase-like protien